MKVSATLKYARISPQKCRLIMHVIRGNEVLHALRTIKFMPQKAARIIAKVLESAVAKIRLGLKQLLPDPLDYFKDKKKRDIITVIVFETLDNGIKVSPDGCPMKILIKKNQIAIDKEDQRTSRFNKGDKVDCMLQDLDLKKRKVSLVT